MTRKVFAALVAVALALGLIVFPPPAAAQSQAAGGAIEGTVTDQSGGVLPGVTVTIRNTATGVTREATTDATGLYRAPLLPIGPYEVTAALAGFSTTKRPNLTLSIGQTLTVDISLNVSGAQEEVTVTAEAPVIDPARTHQAHAATGDLPDDAADIRRRCAIGQ